MDAEIIAVGSELLTPDRVDTNSLYLTEKLNTLGIEVRMKSVVGDDRLRLAEVFRDALERSQLIILTGGLGPTEDDVNREVVAEVLGCPLREVPEIRQQLEKRFARLGRAMSENNLRQALVPEGAEWLENKNGTAPGLWLDHEGIVIVLLPGPPHELESMFESACLPRLAHLAGGERIRTRVLKVVGLPNPMSIGASRPFTLSTRILPQPFLPHPARSKSTSGRTPQAILKPKRCSADSPTKSSWPLVTMCFRREANPWRKLWANT
jgi:nicotinamide-nucleotide amidase